MHYLKRWQADQQYGVGFYKENLVNNGVRPALYTDNALTKTLVSIFHDMNSRGRKLSHDPELNKRLVHLIDGIYPLAFPLLERLDQQGFMWEREWRHPDPKGMVFSHKDIAIICCPSAEEPRIRDLLGDSAASIRFVQVWEEYNDVTDYLVRQQRVWDGASTRTIAREDVSNRVEAIDQQIRLRLIATHSLEAYSEMVERLASEAKRAEEERDRLREEMIKLTEEKEKILRAGA